MELVLHLPVEISTTEGITTKQHSTTHYLWTAPDSNTRADTGSRLPFLCQKDIAVRSTICSLVTSVHFHRGLSDTTPEQQGCCYQFLWSCPKGRRDFVRPQRGTRFDSGYRKPRGVFTKLTKPIPEHWRDNDSRTSDDISRILEISQTFSWNVTVWCILVCLLLELIFYSIFLILYSILYFCSPTCNTEVPHIHWWWSQHLFAP